MLNTTLPIMFNPLTKLQRYSKPNCDTIKQDVKPNVTTATEPPDSTISDWWQQRKPFAEGEDILVHESGDGLIYFGIIVEVDHESGQFLVRYDFFID